eukprot:CAMPEP_0119104816 /NCGR_PEP_ID=MMETSP1180-20130426/2939_1 /TAXON_ID=3052 ORGANISM="Chlamydomonas cf sp, Strain CCMP681" /NCGR_SAMPLE_ID=MMETSP1180 /ASSEMBLY_ACC=CAM_ASM_000741 /LENGTH=69 /DNA_ID=CAMNT_0007089671 /DNA_START=382 /DNA_END=591 /DNA_ORIENTATION=-
MTLPTCSNHAPGAISQMLVEDALREGLGDDQQGLGVLLHGVTDVKVPHTQGAIFAGRHCALPVGGEGNR